MNNTPGNKWYTCNLENLKDSIWKISKNQNEVYALSLVFSCDDDELSRPTLKLHFNTTSYYESRIKDASSEAEAKWNQAFWPDIETTVLGGNDDQLLEEWFKSTEYYYTAKDLQQSHSDHSLLKEIIDRGEKFCNIFIETTIKMVQQIFREEVIRRAFGKDIPILIIELEYYEEPISWTKRANPLDTVTDFIKSYESGMI